MVRSLGNKRPAATLGVAALPFTMREYALALGREHPDDGPAPPRAYFAALGIEDLVSLDVSDYEGADVIFDLNAQELPASLSRRFGVVLNIGTLEHVFHVPNALADIARMLRDEGVALHILPTSNAVDHGFYQFGPTLIFDYYAAPGFELLEAAATIFEPRLASATLLVPLSNPAPWARASRRGRRWHRLDAICRTEEGRCHRGAGSDPVPLHRPARKRTAATLVPVV